MQRTQTNQHVNRIQEKKSQESSLLEKPKEEERGQWIKAVQMIDLITCCKRCVCLNMAEKLSKRCCNVSCDNRIFFFQVQLFIFKRTPAGKTRDATAVHLLATHTAEKLPWTWTVQRSVSRKHLVNSKVDMKYFPEENFDHILSKLTLWEMNKQKTWNDQFSDISYLGMWTWFMSACRVAAGNPPRSFLGEVFRLLATGALHRLP